MKKKKIFSLALILILVLVLLFPIKTHLKDGGSIRYSAILYKVTKVHSLAPLKDIEKGKEYNKGLVIEVLGFKVYDSIK